MNTGWCNGCFDLLTPGHQYFLTLAAMNCDQLVVGLNTDESVRRLKGNGRPIEPFDVRKRKLANWASMVIPFDTEEQLETIVQQVDPQVIFKSEEYYMTYKSPNGGRIFWVPRIPTFSTTVEIAKRRA